MTNGFDDAWLIPEGWTEQQAKTVLEYWPRWSDGTPCMFGDEFTCYPKYDWKEKYERLERLVIFATDHVWNRGKEDETPHDGGYYEWNYMRPGGDDAEEYRPIKRVDKLTVEDVLEEFAPIWEDTFSPTAKAELIAEYAEQIREVMRDE